MKFSDENKALFFFAVNLLLYFYRRKLKLVKKMKYYLFLDECGDQNLANFEPTFPLFTLCGIIISEKSYKIMENKVLALKQKFWKNYDIILHSRDIRKYEKGFQILFDAEIKKSFYEDIKKKSRILQPFSNRGHPSPIIMTITRMATYPGTKVIIYSEYCK